MLSLTIYSNDPDSEAPVFIKKHVFTSAVTAYRTTSMCP